MDECCAGRSHGEKFRSLEHMAIHENWVRRSPPMHRSPVLLPSLVAIAWRCKSGPAQLFGIQAQRDLVHVHITCNVAVCFPRACATRILNTRLLWVVLTNWQHLSFIASSFCREMVPEAGHVKPLSHNMRARMITHAEFKHNIVGHARIFQKIARHFYTHFYNYALAGIVRCIVCNNKRDTVMITNTIKSQNFLKTFFIGNYFVNTIVYPTTLPT